MRAKAWAVIVTENPAWRKQFDDRVQVMQCLWSGTGARVHHGAGPRMTGEYLSC